MPTTVSANAPFGALIDTFAAYIGATRMIEPWSLTRSTRPPRLLTSPAMIIPGPVAGVPYVPPNRLCIEMTPPASTLFSDLLIDTGFVAPPRNTTYPPVLNGMITVPSTIR